LAVMPKKLSENTKAVAARERKNEKNEKEKASREKAAEDAKWVDDDKSLAKKQGKKDEAEKKRQEALAKKKERQDLLAAEAQASVPKSKAAPQKVTQAQIKAENDRRAEAAKKASSIQDEPQTHLSAPLQENINRLQPEGDSASSVTEAIKVLSVNSSEKVDKHPEKRMKAAYTEFEEKRLPELKAENKSLKLSQMKQMIFKEWQKHPDNPMNKPQ